MKNIECTRCYFDEGLDASGKAPCTVCGRSYRPAVNVYLGFVSLVYLVFVRYVSYILTGEFFELGKWPQQAIFHWARWPIDVQFRPEWYLILGAFLALLVMVPVVMGLLYGKRGGYLLAVIALVAGPSWVLGLMLFFCVWLAGGWTLRLHNKVASVTLGCLPAWIYYLVSSHPTTDVALPGAYFVPALLAVVISLLLIALIIAPLRMLHWNTRVVGIAVIAALVVPVASYKALVGEDSMQYAFLVRNYSLSSDTLGSSNGTSLQDLRAAAEQQVDDELKRVAADAAMLNPDPEPLSVQQRQELVDARLNLLKIESENTIRSAIDSRRQATVDHCQSFLSRYPLSRHAPEVLFMMAQAGDLEIDTSNLRDTRAVVFSIRFNYDRAAGDTETIWRQLAENYPDTQYAATALAKLADLEARNGRFAEAGALYDAMIEKFGAEVDQPLPDISNLSLFTDLLRVGEKLERIHRLRHIDEQFRLARAQRALLTENANCPVCGGKILQQYLSADRFLPPKQRQRQLQQLLDNCPKGLMADNLSYELALLESNDRLRIEALEQVVQNFPATDGAALSLYEMARLDSTSQDPAMLRPERALRRYRELQQNYPNFYLSQTVAKQIALLDSAVRRATTDSSPDDRGDM